VAVRIEPTTDERVQRVLENPTGYFEAERERIRREVEAEVGRNDR
jgi:hypothetical protein